MKENLKDILSHLNTEIDQEALLLYLQGKLAPKKQHELEMQALENEFAADALEGLQQMGDKQNLQFVVDGLNRELKLKTEKKKKFREKLRLKNDSWLPLVLFIMLLLIVLSFFILQKMLQK